ncbi:MAG: hypothetical protein Q9207_003368 [Kuettlingeria erythrocarpa]
MGEVNGAYHTAIQEITEQRAIILDKINTTSPDDQLKIARLRNVFARHPFLAKKAFEEEGFHLKVREEHTGFVGTLRTNVTDLLERVKKVRDDVLIMVRKELNLTEHQQKFEFYRRFAQEQHQSAHKTSATLKQELLKPQAALEEVSAMRDQNHSDLEAEREQVKELESKSRVVEVERGLANPKPRVDVKRLSLAEQRIKKDAQAKQQQIGILQKAADESRQLAALLKEDIKKKDTRIQDLEMAEELESAAVNYEARAVDEARIKDQRIRELESAFNETTMQLKDKITNLESTLENKDRTAESLRDEIKQTRQRHESRERTAKEAKDQADQKISEHEAIVQRLQAEVTRAGRTEKNAMRSMMRLLAAICELRDIDVPVGLLDQMMKLHRDWTKDSTELDWEGRTDPTIPRVVFSDAGSQEIVVHILCLWFCVHVASGPNLLENLGWHGQAVFDAASELCSGPLKTWVADAVSKMVSRLVGMEVTMDSLWLCTVALQRVALIASDARGTNYDTEAWPGQMTRWIEQTNSASLR